MAKQCDVCHKPYSDDLDACPHCAAHAESGGAEIDESSVDLTELFDEPTSDDLPERPIEAREAKRAAKTMMAASMDDEAVDLGHGKANEESAPSHRPKTVQVDIDEMEAEARGEAPAPSILDSASAVDLAAGNSSVNLGSSEHLGSADKLQGGRISSLEEEAPTVDHLPEGELPVVEHAAEEELPVVDHAAEDEPGEEEAKPAKKKKIGSSTWVAGAVGMVLGSAASIVLMVLNLMPFVSTGDSGAKPAASAMPMQPVTPAPVAPPAAALAPEQYLASGEFAKAVEGFGAQETQEPALLVKRGQARWLQYLQEKKQANAPLKKDDEAVAQAMKDLTDAKNAEGTLWLGLIEESIAGPAAARKIYQDGAAKFKQPAEQRLFQSALDRLDSAVDAPAGRQARGLARFADTALVLVGLTMSMQEPAVPAAQPPAQPAAQPPAQPAAQPGQPPAQLEQPAAKQEDAPAPAPAKPIEEAGTDFWTALKLAKEHKYEQAAAALAKARTTHDKERYSRLYKAQNPITDPTEMIFLRACDELRAYWQLRQALSQSGYLAQGKQTDPLAALNAALAAAKEAQGPNKALVALAEQLKKDKDVVAADPELKDPAKAIQALTAAKAKSQALVAAVQAALGADEKDPVAAIKSLLDDKKKATDALTAAQQALKAGQVDASADLAQAIAKILADKKAASDNAAATAKKLAEAEDKFQRASKQLDETKYAQATQSRTQGPKQMMEIWLPLLAQDRVPVSRSLCDIAARDAKVVAGDSSTDAATRAMALYVEGLALRGTGKYDEALRALKSSLQTDKTPLRTGDWRFQAQQAARALTDPTAYYVPEARGLVAHGLFDQALARLEEGLAVFLKNTREHGVLLAERSLARLAQAQATGRLSPSDSCVKEAGVDANAAIAAKAIAEGSYALGRWFEAQGKTEQARQAYEQALEAHPALDVAGGRYRAALALLLARQFGPKIPGVGDSQAQAWSPGAFNPLAVFTGLLILMRDEEQELKPVPELDRALQLANEAIQAGNVDGYFAKALVMAARHRWTDAVTECSRGLEKLSGTAPAQARVWRYLIENHPALKIPDGQRPPDVQQAERFFDQGLQYYWDRRYAQAEKEFTQAIRSYDQDARFLYFLGLAQLGQDRRDQAQESFRKAAMLEQLGRPHSTIVSASLERVQGSQRSVLNRYRP